MFNLNKKNDLKPLEPADTPETERILNTLEKIAINPDEVMLVGSAAMALYGIRLYPVDPLTNKYHQRPSDIDFASTASYMEQLHGDRQLSQYVVTRKPDIGNQTILRVASDPMPIDLITRFRDGSGMEAYDQRFRAQMIKKSRPLQGSVVRVATLDTLYHSLKSNSRFDRKAIHDLNSLTDKFPTAASRRI